MKRNKRTNFWRIVFVGVGTLIAVFSSQINKVSAAIDDMHAVYVLLRVEKEVMQKSPAGKYYESLFWKHNDELMQIHGDHPEIHQEFMRITRMFVPGLEALLSDNGDSVRITEEQILSLKAQLNELASIGSPALREDILREQERLPLENFVGMSMTEALDYINTNWSPESTVEKMLVSDSNEEWAYYIRNGVYIEYPGDWLLQASDYQQDIFYVLPSLESAEGQSTAVWKLHIWNIPLEDKDQFDPRILYASDVQWESLINLSEFQGNEVLLGNSLFPIMGLDAFLYNEENQIIVEAIALIKNVQVYDAIDYSRMIDQEYQYFQHLVNSVKIVGPQSVSQPQAIATPMATPVP